MTPSSRYAFREGLRQVREQAAEAVLNVGRVERLAVTARGFGSGSRGVAALRARIGTFAAGIIALSQRAHLSVLRRMNGSSSVERRRIEARAVRRPAMAAPALKLEEVCRDEGLVVARSAIWVPAAPMRMAV